MSVRGIVLVDRGAQGIERWAALRQRFGGSVSHVLGDPACRRFTAHGLEGVIAYREGLGCRVAIGDPIASSADAISLAERFREVNAARGDGTIYACASHGFARACVERGYAAAEFGEELIFDPRAEALVGAAGRELRKKVSRARKLGVAIREYSLEHDGPGLVPSLDAVRRAWLEARGGVQLYIAPVLLYDRWMGRRWFLASLDGRLVGAASFIRLDARQGWLVEHLMWVPAAPPGVTEALIVHAFARMAEEGCAWISFGPTMRSTLGALARVGPTSAALARAVFELVGRLLDVADQTRYRQKFRPIYAQPAHLLFHPPRLGLREVGGLLHAFNLSWKRRGT